MNGLDAVVGEFERFATPNGYTHACRFLAFDSDRWVEFDQYADELRAAIAQAKNRTASGDLVGVDLACGEYAWLPRHFRSEFSLIYLLDQSEAVLAETEPVRDQNTPFILGDAAKTLWSLSGVDFVYGGFSFYRPFVDGVAACLSPTGSFFVMVPADGDDLRWRETATGRTLAERGHELAEIETSLRTGFEVTTEHRTHHWEFAETEIATVVAAVAIVCFGWDQLTPQRKGELAVIQRSLTDRVSEGRFSLTQNATIWRGHRRTT